MLMMMCVCVCREGGGGGGVCKGRLLVLGLIGRPWLSVCPRPADGG